MNSSSSQSALPRARNESAIDLFSPYRLGEVELANPNDSAPMTRSRAGDGNQPKPQGVTYYAQRASAGLIVTEATQVSPQGVGYIRTPGIHSAEQVAGWKRVTAAVHQAGGKIFLQLWHVGRISHPDFHGGALPVAPSAISPGIEVFTEKGPQPTVTPRALELAELPGIVEQYRKGAQNAKLAGFDGVELHGANGYLLDQFTRDGSNKRTDAYGGSIANRARLPLEVTRAVIEVWGAARVGYRISPTGAFNSMSDSDPVAIGYLHVVDPAAAPMRVSPILRKKFNNTYIVNGGFNLAAASDVIARGEADLVAFGALFLANPDLPRRFEAAAPLNTPDQKTFYAGEDKGYVDYPALG